VFVQTDRRWWVELGQRGVLRLCGEPACPGTGELMVFLEHDEVELPGQRII
jgi:hypothetical protein